MVLYGDRDLILVVIIEVIALAPCKAIVIFKGLFKIVAVGVGDTAQFAIGNIGMVLIGRLGIDLALGTAIDNLVHVVRVNARLAEAEVSEIHRTEVVGGNHVGCCFGR